MESYEKIQQELIKAVTDLHFSKELGLMIAKNLGSPKAMMRMCEYLRYVRPAKEEVLIDEMLAIMEEREAWIKKKETQKANEKYNEWLNREV